MTTKTAVPIGIVGTSWWADAMYLPAMKNHPNADVTAVCGRNPERTRQFAERWNIPHSYTDYNAMIDSGKIQALIVSSANDSHYPITMNALDAGLHILCEKPLALTYAQAKEMAEVATQKGVKHHVPFTYSFMPTARYIKELLDDGYIGKPYHLNLRYYTGYGRNNDYGWRFDVGESGAGVVGDLGSHFLYLARWFFGKITKVHALFGHNEKRGPRPDGQPYEQANDSAIIMMTFENGAQGVIHVSAMCYEDTPFGQTHHMEFHGSDGTLYNFTDWDTIQHVSGARTGEGAIKELPIPDHIWGNARRDTVHNTYRDIFRRQDLMARGFITAIVEDTMPKPDFFDGARIQQIMEAAIKSHHEGRAIDVDSIT